MRRALLFGVVTVLIATLLAACEDGSSGSEDQNASVTESTPLAAIGTSSAGSAVLTAAPTTPVGLPPTWAPEPLLTSPPMRVLVTSTPVPAATALPTATPGTSPGLLNDLAPLTAANAAQLTLLAQAAHSGSQIAVAPDRLLLAAAEREGVRLFTLGDISQPVRLLADRDDWIGHATDCVAFTPDGQRVLAGNTEGELRVWDVASYALLDVIQVHDRSIWDCAYSPDGTRLATGSDDDTVKLWDAANLTLLATLLIRDGRDSAFDVAWSPDGTLIGVGSNSTSYVSVWDVAAEAMIFETRGYATMAWAVAFSPDGRWFAAGYDDGVVRVYAMDQLRAGPEPAVEPVAELSGHEALVQTLSFSEDSALLLVGGSVGVLHMWDVGAWAEVAALKLYATGLDALYLAADGTWLVTSGLDDTLKLWGIVAGS